MKEKINIQALLFAIVMIIAGIISPSNGVDDRSYKTPSELITTMFIIITIGLAVYFVLTLAANNKKVSKGSRQHDDENS